jgi:hypothetical protein
MATAPIKDMRRKQRRRRKVHYLRRRLEETSDREQRKRLIAKIRRISSRAPVPEE